MKKQFKRRTIVGLLCLGMLIQNTAIIPAHAENGSGVTLNEICAKNTAYQAYDGNYYDWIELYNGGSSEADISGWGLSDSEKEPYQFVFPEGTRIQSGGRLIVFCDSDAAKTDTNIAPFGISTSGETISLTDTQGNIAHTVTFGSIAEDTSYGQYPDGSGEFYNFGCTPNSANKAPEGSAAVHQPVFSKDSGFYDNSFSLTLTADDGCTIYYTTDGSDPTTESEVYSGPITISDMTNTENRLSARTDIVPGKAEAPRNNVDKAALIRAVSVDKEGRVSEPVTKTYFIGTTNSGYYTKMKVVSLVTDPDNLFDYESGIYCLGQKYGGQGGGERPKEEEPKREEEQPGGSKQERQPEERREDRKMAGNPWEMPANYTQRGKEWERVANFTLFESGQKVLEQNVGIRIKGNYSRSLPQKSFNVYTREDYGAAEFDYDFFSGEAVKAKNGKAIKKYDGLVLRNGGNDNTYAFFRDSINQDLVADRAFAHQATSECIVFIDGEFWGIYQILEKTDKGYLSEHYGVKKSDIAMVKNDELEEGNDEDLNEWLSLCKGVAAGSVSYDEFCSKVDVQGVMDYFAAQIYWANADWPQRNYAVWRSDSIDSENPYADGKWRMILFDTESGQGLYGSYDKSASADCYQRIRSTNSTIGKMFTALLNNSEFRTAYARTLMDLANFNFTTDRTKEVINSYKNNFEQQVLDTFERFQSGSLSGSSGQRRFEDAISTVMNFYSQRYNYAERTTRSAAGLSSEPHKLTVNNNSGSGRIKLNTLDLGKTNGWSGKYHSDYDVTITAVPEEGYTFSHWSVNGAAVTGGDVNSTTISIRLESDATVEAVYTNGSQGNTDVHEVENKVRGDINADGQLGVTDLVLLQKWLTADKSVELKDWKAGDLCEDGVINVYDMVAMRKLLLK